MTSMPRYFILSITDTQRWIRTYSAGVRNDVLDIGGSVNHSGVVGTLLGEVGEAGYFEGEALAVHNVPVECIDLRSLELLDVQVRD